METEAQFYSQTTSKSTHSVPDDLDDAMDEHGYKTVKKRVGGGFKYVKVKIETEPEQAGKKTSKSADPEDYRKEIGEVDEAEKHELEEPEKESADKIDESVDKTDESVDKTDERNNRDSSSPPDSFESFSLPISPSDLRRENTCEDKVNYKDHPILSYIQENVIGNNITISGPFGPKRAVYCDYTASGRSLAFIEDYIRTFVCPFYANTHSETGRNARQTAKFREEARDIIRKCVNAGKDDVVIFTGSGATAGIHKIAWGLKINQPRVAEETVVLTGPYEHHANMLLWKEFGTTVVRIRDGADGRIDMEHLAAELRFWREKRRYTLVCVSAASNVTGIMTDTDAIARLAHQHGALVAFDYAGGGPYLNIDMNSARACYKDAVFISPHKFVGGPGSPGVVVAKKWMFKNQIPDRVGGGTVVYVSREQHAYTTDIEAREEGGTPAIIESIRTGLAFQLKAAVTEKLIAIRDEDLCCRAFSVWERNPNLIVLGSHNAERLTIFSFIVQHKESGKIIHYNFISTLLNDLFGIQSRGGCACAGPYGHDLLGLSEPMSRRLKWFSNVQTGMDSSLPQSPMSIMKPGFVRVNLPYFCDDQTIDYIIKAVDMVATHGWKLLPLYTFNPFSGSFAYKGEVSGEMEEDLFSLQDIDYRGKFHVNRKPPDLASKITLDEMLRDAENVFREVSNEKKARVSTASQKLHDLIPKDKRKLRWFLSPQEASDLLTGAKKVKRYKQIMTPRLDSRLTETDSGAETLKSQVSDTTGTQETAYGITLGSDRSRKQSETTARKDSKVGKLNLGDICEECEVDNKESFKSRMHYSRLQDTSMKMAFPKSPRKLEEIAHRDKEIMHSNRYTSTFQRNNKARIPLPKIT